MRDRTNSKLMKLLIPELLKDNETLYDGVVETSPKSQIFIRTSISDIPTKFYSETHNTLISNTNSTLLTVNIDKLLSETPVALITDTLNTSMTSNSEKPLPIPSCTSIFDYYFLADIKPLLANNKYDNIFRDLYNFQYRKIDNQNTTLMDIPTLSSSCKMFDFYQVLEGFRNLEIIQMSDPRTDKKRIEERGIEYKRTDESIGFWGKS